MSRYRIARESNSQVAHIYDTTTNKLLCGTEFKKLKFNIKSYKEAIDMAYVFCKPKIKCRECDNKINKYVDYELEDLGQYD